MQHRIIDTLKRNQLSITDSRKKILELFFKANGAMAHFDIEQKAEQSLTGLPFTALCRLLLKKASYIPFQVLITRSGMLYVKTIVQGAITTTIMFILCAMIAEPLIALIM